MSRLRDNEDRAAAIVGAHVVLGPILSGLAMAGLALLPNLVAAAASQTSEPLTHTWLASKAAASFAITPSLLAGIWLFCSYTTGARYGYRRAALVALICSLAVIAGLSLGKLAGGFPDLTWSGRTLWLKAAAPLIVACILGALWCRWLLKRMDFV